MKTCLLPAGWGAALFFATCGSTLAAGPLVGYREGTELTEASVLMPVGTTREEFLEQMGPPDAWLSPDIWVYWNQRTNQPQQTRGYGTLLVLFRKDCVQGFKMVPGAPVRRFLAEREKRNPAASLMASYLPA